MILVIIFCILAAGIIWLCIDDWSEIAIALTVTGGIGIALSLFVIAWAYIEAPMIVEANNQRYESLTYQYENGFYENDNDVGKFELVDQIRQWNEDLAANRLRQRNLWIGVYIPNIYDQFEFISLETGG